MQLDLNPCENSYLMDTSALIALDIRFKRENPVFTAVWEEIEDLVAHGCIKTLDFVEEEVNSYEGKEEFVKIWVKKWRKLLVVETDEDVFAEAIPIINTEYSSGFFDAKKQAEGKEEADPYIIAYCKIHKVTLVTDESFVKLNKIPAVCKKNGVDCISIYEFLNRRGLKMERQKR